MATHSIALTLTHRHAASLSVSLARPVNINIAFNHRHDLTLDLARINSLSLNIALNQRHQAAIEAAITRSVLLGLEITHKHTIAPGLMIPYKAYPAPIEGVSFGQATARFADLMVGAIQGTVNPALIFYVDAVLTRPVRGEWGQHKLDIGVKPDPIDGAEFGLNRLAYGIKTAHTSLYDLWPKIRVGHQALYANAPFVRIGHALKLTPSLQARHATLYGVTTAMACALIASYDLLKGDPMQTWHQVAYRSRLDASHRITYQAGAVVKGAHASGYDTSPALSVKHQAGYQGAVALHVSHGAFYQTTGQLAASHAMTYVARHDLGAGFIAAWDLTLNTPLVASHTMAWYGDSLAVFAPHPDVSVWHGHTRLDFERIEWLIDEESVGWSASITLLDYAQYAGLQANSPITIKADGHEWALVVANKAIRRSFGERDMEVLAVSPVAQLESVPFDGDLTGQLASATVGMLVDGLDWRLEDWVLTDAAVFYETDKLAVIKAITQAVGGIVQAGQNGLTVARHKYPNPLNTLDTATVDFYIAADTNLIDIAESMVQGKRINRVIVTNNQDDGQSGQHDYSVTMLGATTARIDVYTAKNPQTLTLLTTGNPDTV
ncbi:MAG: hypothetical protein WCS28_11770, partial [Thiomicrospira sp.]